MDTFVTRYGLMFGVCLGILNKLGVLDVYDETCLGIRLAKYKQYHVQLWYCPPGYVIVEHKHSEEHIELIYLYGEATFFRREKLTDEAAMVTPQFPRHAGRNFTIPAGWYHWFSVNNKALVFINVAKFLPQYKPKSAAVDFQAADYQ